MAPASDEKADGIERQHHDADGEELRRRLREYEARRSARTVRPIEPWQVTISPSQAAGAAGVALSTIWLWVSSGKLESRLVGGRRLINRKSFDALIGAKGE